jgi:hypothetical protein
MNTAGSRLLGIQEPLRWFEAPLRRSPSPTRTEFDGVFPENGFKIRKVLLGPCEAAGTDRNDRGES